MSSKDELPQESGITHESPDASMVPARSKAKLYTDLAHYYDAIVSEYCDTDLELEYLTGVISRYHARTVLDVGCGTGRHCWGLADAGFRVIGMDLSLEMLKLARAKGGGGGVRYFVSDAGHFALRQPVDAAICMWSTFAELPYRGFVGCARDTVKRGGILIIDQGLHDELIRRKRRQHSITVQHGDGILRVLISDDAVGCHRRRRTKYVLQESEVYTEITTDMLDISDYQGLLQPFFELVEAQYDFGLTIGCGAQRIQMVFRRVLEY